MRNYVSWAFKGLTQTEILVFATNIVLKMLADLQFLAFKSEVEVLDLITKGYNDALNAASNKDAVLVLLKNNKRTELDNQLTVVANLVNSLAKGDKAIIMASGYDYIKDPKAISELLAPTGFEVNNVLKQPGKVKLSWDEVKGVNNYALEMRIKGEELWVNCAFPSARSVVIKDLKLGTNVEFRVRALGTRNLLSDWSTIIDVWVS